MFLGFSLRQDTREMMMDSTKRGTISWSVVTNQATNQPFLPFNQRTLIKGEITYQYCVPPQAYTKPQYLYLSSPWPQFPLAMFCYAVLHWKYSSSSCPILELFEWNKVSLVISLKPNLSLSSTGGWEHLQSTNTPQKRISSLGWQ